MGVVGGEAVLRLTNWSENGTSQELMEFVCFQFISKVDFKTPTVSPPAYVETSFPYLGMWRGQQHRPLS